VCSCVHGVHKHSTQCLRRSWWWIPAKFLHVAADVWRVLFQVCQPFLIAGHAVQLCFVSVVDCLLMLLYCQCIEGWLSQTLICSNSCRSSITVADLPTCMRQALSHMTVT